MKRLWVALLCVLWIVVSASAAVTRFPSISQQDFLPPGFVSSPQADDENMKSARDYQWPLLSCPQNPQPDIPIPSKDLPRVTATLNQIENDLRALLAKYNMPGVAASVTLGQKVIWAKGLGYANKTSKIAPTPDTPFRIGSISKVFATLMMMQLRDKGLISLDEEISQKFPKVQLQNPFKTDRGMTWRQLASHLAALPRSSPCASLWGDCNVSTDVILARLKQESYIQPIDDRPSYSNLGFAMLGNLLAEIVGMPYNEYLQKHILDPLGMTNTGMIPTPDILKKFAVGYLFNSDTPAPLYDLGWENPAGGMYSTVNDLAKLLSLLFRENMSAGSIPSQILDGQTIKEWLLPTYDTGVLSSKVLVAQGTPWECFLDTTDPVASKYWYKGKDGAVLGFTSQIYAIPDLQLGVAVLMNGGLGGPAGEFALAISSKLVPLLDKIFAENAVPPPLPPDVSKYVGAYVGSGSNWPFWFTSLSANISVVKDSVGNSRLKLVYEVKNGDTSLMVQMSYLDWKAGEKAFVLSDLDPTCGSFLGGSNQWVPFTQNGGKFSFTIPGLWYGFTFTKHD